MGAIQRVSALVSRPRAAFQGLRRAEDGVAAVELAFIAALLAGMMIGVYDYGSAWIQRMSLLDAVRAGTLYTTIRRPVDGDTSEIEQAVIDAAPPAPASPLTRTLVVAELCACPGNAPGSVDCLAATATCAPEREEKFVSITLQEDFEMMFDWPWFNNPITLNADGLLRYQ